MNTFPKKFFRGVTATAMRRALSILHEKDRMEHCKSKCQHAYHCRQPDQQHAIKDWLYSKYYDTFNKINYCITSRDVLTLKTNYVPMIHA